MKFLPRFSKSSINKIENEACLNCGQPFMGHEKFCSYCGQKNASKKLTFGLFINNLVAGFFSYDSRFWTTFIPLISKPGKVSKDYIDGKRARFVNPFQLYLNVSIIFFLILGISNKIDHNSTKITQASDTIKQTKQEIIDSILTTTNQEIAKNNLNDSLNISEIKNFSKALKLINEDSTSVYNYHIHSKTNSEISFSDKINDFQHFYQENPTLNTTKALESLGYKNTFWNNFYYQEIINLNRNWEKYNTVGWREYFNKTLSYLSISLFVFLPIFTLFLKLLYLRSKFTYMEHLVFVFNTQTVFFLLLLIFYLLNFMVNMQNTAWVFILVFLLYLYQSMRNFYAQSRGKTFIKYVLLNSFYCFLAIIGTVITAAISFFTN